MEQRLLLTKDCTMNTPPNNENTEFPKGKESYCPRCYFEDEKVVLRIECPHAKSLLSATPNNEREGWRKELKGLRIVIPDGEYKGCVVYHQAVEDLMDSEIRRARRETAEMFRSDERGISLEIAEMNNLVDAIISENSNQEKE